MYCFYLSKNQYLFYINHNNDKANASLVPFGFGIDSSGNYGYIKAGADSVTPFKTGGSNIYDLGTGTSFNVSSYEGYENFTIDNFLYKVTNMNIPAMYQKQNSQRIDTDGRTRPIYATIETTNAVNITPTLTYNNTIGVLSVTNTSLSLKVIAIAKFSNSSVYVYQTYTCNLTIRMYLVV